MIVWNLQAYMYIAARWSSAGDIYIYIYTYIVWLFVLRAHIFIWHHYLGPAPLRKKSANGHSENMVSAWRFRSPMWMSDSSSQSWNHRPSWSSLTKQRTGTRSVVCLTSALLKLCSKRSGIAMNNCTQTSKFSRWHTTGYSMCPGAVPYTSMEMKEHGSNEVQ